MKIEKTLAQNDSILGSIIAQIPEPELLCTNDVFHDLMSCIVEQQIHYRSTKKIFAKAMERASIEHLIPENFYLFEKQALSQLKLSASKIECINSFIDYWTYNNKDFNLLSDDEVISELSSIKGIGKWTIDMILLYTLKRPNVFPVDDFHLKQIMVSLYHLDEKVTLKAQMLKISENWGQNKSLAVLYLLAYKEFVKKHK
jgi:DNA-3-methyladenine glycosylase II